MKKQIQPVVTVEPGTSKDANYGQACAYTARLLRLNINMLAEITPKAVEKYELTKTANFYETKTYAGLSYTDIDVTKLVHDFIKIDSVLCVDESYFFKDLSCDIYGFMAIGMPIDRNATNDAIIEHSVLQVSELIGIIPDNFRFLYKNIGEARLARLVS